MRNKNSIKRVLVNSRQASGELSMPNGNRQLDKSVPRNDTRNIRRNDTSFGHFANPEFCRYLPGRSRADEYLVAGIGNRVASDY